MPKSEKNFAELMAEAEVREANRRYREHRPHRQIAFVLTVITGPAACIVFYFTSSGLLEIAFGALYSISLLHHEMVNHVPRLFGHPDFHADHRYPTRDSEPYTPGKLIALFAPLGFIILQLILT